MIAGMARSYLGNDRGHGPLLPGEDRGHGPLLPGGMIAGMARSYLGAVRWVIA